jgi:hypothetical protein
MYRDEVVYPLQAELRIVRRSTIERKQMSTKTTFKRIALVAVAALGFGVLSVVPSQATVSGLTVSTPTAGSAGSSATGGKTDSTTASTFTVSALFDSGLADTVTVSFVKNGNYPTGATTVYPYLTYLETATAVETQVDTTLVQASSFVTAYSDSGRVAESTGLYSISRTNPGYAGAKFGLYLDSATSTTRPAGDYNFTVIVKAYSDGVATPVTTNYPVKITVAAAATPAAAAAGFATAYLQAGSAANLFTGTVLADSVTAGSLVAGGKIGQIQVKNNSAVGVSASDTVTVKMTGSGYLVTDTSPTITGREFTVLSSSTLNLDIKADGSAGTGTITITTEKGASFVKTVTFFDQKPSKAVATVSKAFIKAGTTQVNDVFLVAVTDAAGTPVKDAVVTATVTDTTTTVGGAATCETTYDETDKGFYCHVKGLSTTKFGPVAYTIKATGANAAKTVVTTSATVTFADNVATKAVLAGPASGAPGASVEYTITLTEKNGYPVADDVYGVGNAPGGVLFSSAATGRVASGWTTAPFATTDSFTSVSGVITSKGTLPLAGTATGTWTLVGDGLQTLAADAIDKTIGKTKITATTEVVNAAADAATAAAEAAEAAAQDATDAALDATTAAEAAGALAQEAVDAVAELSAEVTKLMAGVKAQITYLTKLVMRLAAK